MSNFRGGRSLVVDVGVTDPLQAKFLARNTYTRLDAAAAYEQLKFKRYAAKLETWSYVFKPAVWEAFGGVGDSACFLVRSLASALKTVRGQSYETIRRDLQQRIGVAIWVSNARMILARIPKL